MNQDPIKLETKVVNDQSHKSQPVVKVWNLSKIINLALLGLLALLLLPAIWVRLNDRQSSQTQKTPLIQQSAVDKNNQSFVENSISSVVEKVSPSVVSIVTSSINVFTFDTEQSGAGTGVILSDSGYILTNKHVVKNSDQLTVITSDGETYDDVKVVFQDPFNDLAFLKVSNPKNFKAIEIGDSKTIKVGQSVIAIGNSLGQYQNTVTRGIISGTNRSIAARGSGGVENLTDMLQTDAAINPGNSGGPLVNAGGQLIGINTAVTQGANGLGFAIPISAAKGVIKQLGQDDQQIQRVMLGVRYVAINPAIAKEKKLSDKQGALIAGGIIKGSSADKAGLKEGDIILKINGLEVGKAGGFNTLLSEYAVGEEVELLIKRDGEQITAKTKLQAAKN